MPNIIMDGGNNRIVDGGNTGSVCTWHGAKECEGCILHNELKCRVEIRAQIIFIMLFACFAIPAIIGMLLGGYGWFLAGWFIFMLLTFMFWEARVLCSYCPFWAEESLILHCLANSGIVKSFRFRPEPINRIEKMQFVLIIAILFGYPVTFMLLGAQYILTGIALCGAVLFSWAVYKYSCSRCVNFSCIFNHVPGPIVDMYLNKNPVMKNAWEKSGYRANS